MGCVLYSSLSTLERKGIKRRTKIGFDKLNGEGESISKLVYLCFSVCIWIGKLSIG